MTSPQAWEHQVGGPGQGCLRFEVVVHSNQSAGSSGGAGGDESALQHERPQAAARQVEGEARSVNPAADDDDVCCIGHVTPVRTLHTASFAEWPFGVLRYHPGRSGGELRTSSVPQPIE
jgi:hypothetical protein